MLDHWGHDTYTFLSYNLILTLNIGGENYGRIRTYPVHLV